MSKISYHYGGRNDVWVNFGRNKIHAYDDDPEEGGGYIVSVVDEKEPTCETTYNLRWVKDGQWRLFSTMKRLYGIGTAVTCWLAHRVSHREDVNLVFIGPSYCGKSFLIENAFNYESDEDGPSKVHKKIYHVGDLSRAAAARNGEKPKTVLTAKEVGALLPSIRPSQTPLIIIDNLFKTKEGVAVLDELPWLTPESTLILNVKREMLGVDTAERKREDDVGNSIERKRIIWFEEQSGILGELDERGFRVEDVENPEFAPLNKKKDDKQEQKRERE